MPKSLPVPPPPSRYSYRAAVEEIGRCIDEEAKKPNGLTQKQIAGAANLDESAFSHRRTGAKSKLTLEHIGAIADFLNAPPGWPFVPGGDAPNARPTKKKR